MIVTGGPGNRMSPRAVIRGGVLTFTAVDSTDEGEYVCKALNTHGEHTAQASLFIQSTLYVCVCVCGHVLFICVMGTYICLYSHVVLIYLNRFCEAGVQVEVRHLVFMVRKEGKSMQCPLR